MRLTALLRIRYQDIGELTKKYANLPETFLKRKFEVIEYKTPRGFIQYRRKTLKRKDYNLTESRPWTEEFRMENEISLTYKKVWVEPIKDWSIFKGDTVEILVGKDKGKQGQVVQVIQERNWVFVEGLNMKVEEFGKTKDTPGTYIQREQPLLVTCEVELVDPNDLIRQTTKPRAKTSKNPLIYCGADHPNNPQHIPFTATPDLEHSLGSLDDALYFHRKPVKIEWRYTEEGKRVRVSLRSGRIIPLPVEMNETLDYKERKLYIESPKDSKEDDVKEVTFQPMLETFEMAIAKEHGIKEDRVPVPTMWY